jgi:hypothetical protein
MKKPCQSVIFPLLTVPFIALFYLFCDFWHFLFLFPSLSVGSVFSCFVAAPFFSVGLGPTSVIAELKKQVTARIIVGTLWKTSFNALMLF